MARTRSLKPSFFTNDILAECDPMARLLFAGLWTIADRDGRIEYRPRRIKGALFPYDNCDIEALVKQLADRGFVQVYTANGLQVLSIPTFGEHQRCHPDERSEGLPGPDEAEQNSVSAGKNAEPGNPAHEPGNFPADAPKLPATCALYPSTFSPSTSSPSVAPSDPPQRRKRSQPAASIGWTAEAGWTGITDADRSEWLQAFPGAVLEQELAKSTAWLRANPTKAGKRNWRGFLVRWLARCQDRGGTNREPRGTGPPGPAPVPQERRRYYRADAGCSMTDKDYAAWRRDRQTGGIVSQVAGSLTVKEEQE